MREFLFTVKLSGSTLEILVTARSQGRAAELVDKHVEGYRKDGSLLSITGIDDREIQERLEINYIPSTGVKNKDMFGENFVIQNTVGNA